MLGRIELELFQSHLRSVLELDPCFNIITGQSGSGKSAFLRALNSLFYNNLTGTAFRTVGKNLDDALPYKVTAYFRNGTAVSRAKGTSMNRYAVGKENFENGILRIDTNQSKHSLQIFDNVKTDVPDPIRQALNIYPVTIDSNKEINIQYAGQFDAPFMLMESAPTKMKFLNALSGTYAVDLAVKSSNRKLAEAKKQVDTTDLEIAKYTLESADYEKKISAIETANKYIAEHYTTLQELKAELAKMQELKKQLDKLTDAFKKLNKMDALFSKVDADKAIKSISRLVELSRLQKSYATMLSAHKANQKAYNLYNSVPTDRIEKAIDTFRLTKDLENSYNRLKNSVKDNNAAIKASVAEFNQTVGSYTQALEEVKVCPVCKSTITGEVVSHIKETIGK